MEYVEPIAAPTIRSLIVEDTPILSSSLIIYAYFLSSMFFAPIIPSVWLFALYLVAVEILTYTGYKLLGMKWRLEDRIVVVSSAVAGYVVGMGIYSAALLVQERNKNEATI